MAEEQKNHMIEESMLCDSRGSSEEAREAKPPH